MPRPARSLTTEVTSFVHLPDAWYAVAIAKTLRSTPRSSTLFGQPIVTFRDASGRPSTLLDRCPHRNVPLSLGRVVEGRLECAYHGWQFDGDGTCQVVPGLCRVATSRGRTATAFETREQQGLIWVWGAPNALPTTDPPSFPHVGEAGYHTVYDVVEAQGTLHAAAENALDVPHTSFLHRGLFRGGKARNEIEVVVRRFSDRCEAEYIGEPRPSGLVGRLLAPGGGEVIHFDRFILPCLVQVEYRLGERSHLFVNTALTPLSRDRTRLFAVIAFRLPLPGFLVAPLVRPIARAIFAQDARILRAQHETISRFGGEQFHSTEVDALGPHILHLMRQAAKGGSSTAPEEPYTRRFTLLT